MIVRKLIKLKYVVSAMSLILIVSQIVSINAVIAEAKAFNDVSSSHWAYSVIEQLSERKIIDGYPDGNFYPEKIVTRAEWAKMLVEAEDIPLDNQFLHLALENCGDLSKRNWAAPYMVAVSDYLPPTNSDATYYYPERGVLREEAAASIVKMKGIAPTYIDNLQGLNNFNDAYSVTGDVQGYVDVAILNGYVDGYDDNTFRPQSTLTRAEAAAILARVINEDASYVATFATEPLGSLGFPMVLVINAIDDNSVFFRYYYPKPMSGNDGEIFYSPDINAVALFTSKNIAECDYDNQHFILEFMDTNNIIVKTNTKERAFTRQYKPYWF